MDDPRLFEVYQNAFVSTPRRDVYVPRACMHAMPLSKRKKKHPTKTCTYAARQKEKQKKKKPSQDSLIS